MPSALSAVHRPNILIILTDDQGWGDLAANGNPLIDTPNLDRLKKESVSFKHFFVNPTCAPTRAALLTGRYPEKVGVFNVTDGLERLDASAPTLPQLLQQAGYRTHVVGKWHNGLHYPNHPVSTGFDSFFGFCAGGVANHFDAALEWSDAKTLSNPDVLEFSTHPHQPVLGNLVRTKGYITDVLTEAAIEFISEQGNHPFFLYLPYNAPHSPLQAPQWLFQKYKARGLSDGLAGVYAMVESIDANVGRLLLCLRENGIEKETIVVFLSDNGPGGPRRYNAGMKGRKARVDEGGVRVPAYFRWPDHWRGDRQVEQIAAHIDILPTLAELLDIKLPTTLQLDGQSLAQILATTSETHFDWNRELFAAKWTRQGQLGGISLRTQTHRLTMHGEDIELYDMQADPRQSRDLSSTKPALTKSLSDQMESWLEALPPFPFKPVPIPVGDPNCVISFLPQSEARISEGIAYKAKYGFTTDYLVDWDQPSETICWEILVSHSGRFRLDLLYQCPSEDIGATIRSSIGPQSRDTRITTSYDPESLPDHDLVPRNLIVHETSWAIHPAGEFELQPGPAQVSLQAPAIPGRQALILRAARLVRLN